MPIDEDVVLADASRDNGHVAAVPDSLNMLGTFSVVEIAPNRKRQRYFTAIMSSAPAVTNGYGGWSRVARPRQGALTEWVGRDTLSVTIPFVLDDFAMGRGLYTETKCQILEELAGVDSGDPQPPLLELHSNPDMLMPHGYARASQNKWFIDSLSWDQDNIRYNRAGNRIRASGTLVLSVFVEDERLHPAGETRKGSLPIITPGGSRRKTYRVLAGDTLHKIAARKDTYNDWHKWKLIAKANHIRSSKQLRQGRVLKLP